MTDILADYKQFTDQYGLVQPPPFPVTTSGNGLRYTSEYIAALLRTPDFTPEEHYRLQDVFFSCMKNPGLLSRSPIATNQEGPDDYYATIFASRIVNNQMLQSIFDYGYDGVSRYNPDYEEDKIVSILGLKVNQRTLSKLLFLALKVLGLGKVRYVWNNVNPGYFTLSSWLGRQLPLVCQLKAAVKVKPSLLERLASAVSIVMSARDATGQDSKILTWFQVMVLEGQYSLIDLAIKYWRKKFKQQWPGGVGQVLGVYFGDTTHPSVKYLWEVF